MPHHEVNKDIRPKKKLGSGMGNLCAAIPGLMGFYPQESLIIMTFFGDQEGGEQTLGPLVRCDLSVESIAEGAAMIKKILDSEIAIYIKVIIVTEKAQSCEDLSLFQPWVEMTTQICLEQDMVVNDFYGSPSLTTDSWWASLDNDDLGWISEVEDMHHKIQDSPEGLFGSREELQDDLSEQYSPHIWCGWMSSDVTYLNYSDDLPLLRKIHRFLSWWYDSPSVSSISEASVPGALVVGDRGAEKDKLFLILSGEEEGEEYRRIVKEWAFSTSLFPLFFMISCSPQGKTLRELWHRLALYSTPPLRHKFLLMLALTWWILGQGVRACEALSLAQRSLEECYSQQLYGDKENMNQKERTGEEQFWDNPATLESLGNIYRWGKISEVLKGMSDYTLDYLAHMLMASAEEGEDVEEDTWDAIEGIYSHIYWEGLGFPS